MSRRTTKSAERVAQASQPAGLSRLGDGERGCPSGAKAKPAGLSERERANQSPTSSSAGRRARPASRRLGSLQYGRLGSPMPLGFEPVHPAGMNENSPAFQRRVSPRCAGSPAGTTEGAVPQSSLRDWGFWARQPNAEALGFCRSSLRDKARCPGQQNPSGIGLGSPRHAGGVKCPGQSPPTACV